MSHTNVLGEDYITTCSFNNSFIHQDAYLLPKYLLKHTGSVFSIKRNIKINTNKHKDLKLEYSIVVVGLFALCKTWI